MTPWVEDQLYHLSQLFLLPAWLAIVAMLALAFVGLGRFLAVAWQRRRGRPPGRELLLWAAAQPVPDLAALELEALRRLEPLRLVARAAPLLGLVATMIPLGPALRAMAEGRMVEVAQQLAVAFSAVILALVAAAIAHTTSQVWRRWYATDLAGLQASGAGR